MTYIHVEHGKYKGARGVVLPDFSYVNKYKANLYGGEANCTGKVVTVSKDDCVIIESRVK